MNTLSRVSIMAAIAAISGSALGTIAGMPPQTGSFTGATRGYWFTAPTNFAITGVKVLRVEGNTSATVQNFAIVRFNGAVPPPNFSATTNDFTQLALGLGQAPDVFSPVNAIINAGDVIGIYGNMAASGSATAGFNSYGNGSLGTVIDGNNVVLNRSGMQFHLGSATTPSGMQDIFGEPSSVNITRIEFQYGAVPEPATLTTLAIGALALARRRRKA